MSEWQKAASLLGFTVLRRSCLLHGVELLLLGLCEVIHLLDALVHLFLHLILQQAKQLVSKEQERTAGLSCHLARQRAQRRPCCHTTPVFGVGARHLPCPLRTLSGLARVA